MCVGKKLQKSIQTSRKRKMPKQIRNVKRSKKNFPIRRGASECKERKKKCAGNNAGKNEGGSRQMNKGSKRIQKTGENVSRATIFEIGSCNCKEKEMIEHYQDTTNWNEGDINNAMKRYRKIRTFKMLKSAWKLQKEG